MPSTQSGINQNNMMTAWSIVADSAFAAEDRQSQILNLCRAYFYPVYAHIRSSAPEPSSAYAQAQGFLEETYHHLLVNEPEERFRTFLFRSLEAFSKHPTPGTGAIQGLADSDAVEARYQGDEANGPSSQDAFEARFARELIIRTLARLKKEAEHNGKAMLFDELVLFLTVEPSAEQTREIANKLDLSPLSFTIALKRLRARYVEIGNEELAATILDPSEIDAERTLFQTILIT